MVAETFFFRLVLSGLHNLVGNRLYAGFSESSIAIIRLFQIGVNV
jgi:hypothetical protein